MSKVIQSCHRKGSRAAIHTALQGGGEDLVFGLLGRKEDRR